MHKDLHNHIQFLKSNTFKAKYPSCNGKLDLPEKALFGKEKFILEANKLLKERNELNTRLLTCFID